MIIPKPIEVKERINPGKLLYRGFYHEKDLTKYNKGVISPDDPLNININSPSEMIELLFRNQKLQKHIRGLEKRRFISFSLQKHVACYYATARYKRRGYIAIVKFPHISKAITIDSRGPYVHKCIDGTIWIDLRSLLSFDRENMGAHSRTLVDHELLLMRGTIRPIEIIPIKPENCDRSFVPWSEWGEKIRIKS